ncbi:hypothetical protein CU097_012597 [Rhizopus azygosporus]|uniref:Uncharacterized protein n=1 Tax=Rhizopus azygosporus TaxID=86630 RepID=A0A367KF12_RHIAZ|nr:hypothetical protein CU097_012597 [Rhizopus azygosporus]
MNHSNKRPKSILKYRPENQRPTTSTSPITPVAHSWLSRIQSKILSPPNEENQEREDGVSLRKHDLKRVTFSVGNLIEEHSFAFDDSPRDVEYEKERQLRNKIQQELTHVRLADYYDHACIQRDGEGVIDQFRHILRHCRSLETIDLSGATITLQHAGSFSDILMLKFGLKYLNLSNCKMDDETIRILLCSLLVSNTVIELNLSQNNIKSKGYRYIAIFIKESKKIQSINLSKNSIDKRGMQYLAQGIQLAGSLEKLQLDEFILKPPQILQLLSEGIKKHPGGLSTLSLCNYRIPPSSTIHLANLLSSNISTIDLSGCQQFQIPILAYALINNNTLLHLCLSNCKITSHDLSTLSKALLENNCMESLDLSKNPLLSDNDEGILELKTAIARNRGLQSLNLSETQLDSAATIALAEALSENTCLSRLDLSRNPQIDMAGILALSISIKMNHTLTFLDINIPPHDEELANLQNDIVAVCTTNMLQKIEQQRQKQQTPSASSSSSSSSSSYSDIDLDIQPVKIPSKSVTGLLDEPESSTELSVVE